MRIGSTQANGIVLFGMLILGFGLLLPGCWKARNGGTGAASTNNLKQIGLGAQGFHDVQLRFPGNGSGVGEGFATMQEPFAAPFHYQILPNIEQDALYRQSATPMSPINSVVRTYLEFARARNGLVNGNPVADYAVNLVALYGIGVPPTADNITKTLTMQEVIDGTSSTILVGQKSLAVADYGTTNPAIDATFLKLSSGGTNTVGARYTIGASVLAERTAAPEAAYLSPTTVRDVNAVSGPSDQFGGPYAGGVLFVFADGHVQSLSYNWLHPDNTVPISLEKWGTDPVTGSFNRVSQFRAALTPNGKETYNLE